MVNVKRKRRNTEQAAQTDGSKKQRRRQWMQRAPEAKRAVSCGDEVLGSDVQGSVERCVDKDEEEVQLLLWFSHCMYEAVQTARD